MEAEEKKITVEEAKKAIQEEQQERIKGFNEEYLSLCKKYNCEIVQNGLVVIAR